MESMRSEEIKQISSSLSRLGAVIYTKVLECPNLKDCERECEERPLAELDFKKISAQITNSCIEMQCGQNQTIACNDGNCRYMQRLEDDLLELQSEIMALLQDVV